MSVLVVAATKGGVGKTTLAAAIAAEGSRRGKQVAVIDIDPQSSLGQFVDARREFQGKDDIRLIEVGDGKHLDRTLEAALQGHHDLLVIDTPPGSIERTALAVGVANLVLIPVRPSPIDVQSMDAIAELAREKGRDFVFVLNQTTPRSAMTEHARSYLSRLGPVLDVEIGSRQNYSRAMLDGLTAGEISNSAPAEAEIVALYDAIEKRLRAGARKVSAKARIAS